MFNGDKIKRLEERIGELEKQIIVLNNKTNIINVEEVINMQSRYLNPPLIPVNQVLQELLSYFQLTTKVIKQSEKIIITPLDNKK